MSITPTSTAETLGAAPAAEPRAGFRNKARNAAQAVIRSPRMLSGTIILLVFVVIAIFGPLFAHNPDAFVGPTLSGPSAKFWLGTTQTGQSVFAQLILSARDTLEVGFAAGLLATVVALAIGLGGAFGGGLGDDLLNLLTNVVLVIPALPLIIIVAAYLKSEGLGPTILVIAVTSWAGSARVLRGLTLSLRNRDYIAAARVSGERAWRIVAVELLPNLMAYIISSFIFTVIFAILTQTGLAFIGVTSPNILTWGNMLYFAENDQALSSGAWWWFVPPGLCIALIGTGLALINIGLDEVLNPRLRVFRPARRRGRRASAGNPGGGRAPGRRAGQR
jgi:peptide/nickel transport system permease protein